MNIIDKVAASNLADYVRLSSGTPRRRASSSTDTTALVPSDRFGRIVALHQLVLGNVGQDRSDRLVGRDRAVGSGGKGKGWMGKR